MKHKWMALTLVIGLLMFGLVLTRGVVDERLARRSEASASVAQSLAGKQVVLGPLIQRDCVDEQIGGKSGSGAARVEYKQVAVPQSLRTTATAKVEPRARGLYTTQAFTLNAEIHAIWGDLSAIRVPASTNTRRVQCGAPTLMLAVLDSRGIREAKLTLAGEALALKPATLHGAHPRGLHAKLPGKFDSSEPLSARLQLELVGIEQLEFVPAGESTQVQLRSNWPHPSFGGAVLPSERHIDEQGFEAQWRISDLASHAPQQVQKDWVLCSGGADVAEQSRCLQTVSVRFIDTQDSYVLSDRAVKYGALFILLSFLAVGLVELMKALRVHPIQYLLVGCALSLFFLLLLSLSEHLPFGLAYGLASSACVGLLTFYGAYVLNGWARGAVFGGAIALLYGLLFVLLTLEQAALLAGALSLFAILAAVLVLTRKIDWYAKLAQMGGARQPPAATAAPEAPAR